MVKSVSSVLQKFQRGLGSECIMVGGEHDGKTMYL